MMMLIAYQTLAFCTCHLYLVGTYMSSLKTHWKNILTVTQNAMKQCYPKNEFRLSDLNLIFLTWVIVNVTKNSLSSDTDLEDSPWCLVEIWRQKKGEIRMQKLI